ncbi:MAG: formate dehydrogenase subunit delta [Burkholderiales bacterium]|nr:formate dehydrogenase subunit delta [Burkholderiales bacterium]
MNISNLVKMANQIETFFRAEADPDAAVAGIESHLRRNWEPRMRRALAAALGSGEAAELGSLARLAVQRLDESGKSATAEKG